MIMYTYLYQTL